MPVLTGTSYDDVREGHDDVQEGLRAFARLPKWLADAMDGEQVCAALRRHVPEPSDGGPRLLGVRPERLRAKDDGWVARYAVTLGAKQGADQGADQGPSEVVLTGSLVPPAARSAPIPAPDPAPGPVGSTAAFGEPGWVGWLPELRLRLATEVTDSNLPALPMLTEPEAARALLEQAIGEEAYPGIRIAGCEPDVVRYKPGSRCTVVYRLSYDQRRDGWPELVVAKTHQGDKGANAFAAMRALWATPLAAGRVVSIAEPLAFLPEPRILVQGPVAEDECLKDVIRAAVLDGGDAALRRLREELRKTADGLVALHRSGVRHGRLHTWWDELAEVRAVTARLERSVPGLHAAAGPLLERLERVASAVPADPAGPSHHDFRPAQVLLHAGRVGFIDFDGFCTAEPALDLGRFCAKLRDIGIAAKGAQELPAEPALSRRLGLLDELCEGFVDRYAAQAPLTRARVQLWETLDLVTALLHAWTKVRLARVMPRLTLLQHQVRTVTPA